MYSINTMWSESTILNNKQVVNFTLGSSSLHPSHNVFWFHVVIAMSLDEDIDSGDDLVGCPNFFFILM